MQNKQAEIFTARRLSKKMPNLSYMALQNTSQQSCVVPLSNDNCCHLGPICDVLRQKFMYL